MSHCEDCAPEFGCWSDRFAACRRRPATAEQHEIARLRDLITNLRWALEFVDEKTRLEGNRGAKVEQVLTLALYKCRNLTPLTELPKCELEMSLLGP